MTELLEHLCPSWCVLRRGHAGPHRGSATQDDSHRTGCGCATCGPTRRPADFNAGDADERHIAALEDLLERALGEIGLVPDGYQARRAQLELRAEIAQALEVRR